MSIFSAMTCAAESHDLPTSHHADLSVHDQAWLARRSADDTFLWLLYEHGTHTLDLSTRDYVRSLFRTLADCFTRYQRHQWFHWDGYALRPINDDAARRVARDHDEALPS